MEREIFEMYCPTCGIKNRIKVDLASLSEVRVKCGNCDSYLPISPAQIKEYFSANDNSEHETEDKQGLSIFQKFGFVTILLFLTRYSLEFISNDTFREYLVIGVLVAFVIVPFLRKIFLQVMLAITLIVTSTYCILNFQNIKKGKI